MKVKTSITLSDSLLPEIDRCAGEVNRSEFIENAVIHYISELKRQERDQNDLRILNQNNWQNLEHFDYQNF
ncbi:MAG: hypothetical protein KDK41_08765 [Leptospiraceae bacterium]|nr:hypothetical protein [Leptospiraceae bacterium]MCB1200723.1 hypothetical protein [Leptospiraceae bacterium]